MSKNIFVFVEQRDKQLQKGSIELIGKARELASDLGQEVVAVLLGSGMDGLDEDLIAHGADRVIVADDPLLAEYMTAPYAKTLADIIHTYEPEVVLYGATSIGRDLAPRVSARIHTGLTADCTGLAIDAETKLLMMTRPAFGGNIMATITCAEHRPQMATVRPGVMKPLPKDPNRKGETIRFDAGLSASDLDVKLVEVIPRERKSVDIADAKVLVSGGRGIGGAEKIEMLEALAHALGGEVASSRANVDAGWIDHDRQVGQTGKTVHPKVYFACGISGAIQHLVGMEESECIIAINTNPEALIFNVADLGIVGDLNVIVPKLTQAVEAYRTAKL